MESALGYKRIFVANKDVRIVDDNSPKANAENAIFLDSGKGRVFQALSAGASAIAFTDMRINKKALEQMQENDVALCMPISALTSSYGFQRSRSLHMMGMLMQHAIKMEIEVSFVTLASNNANLCSAIQLIEIARLMGCDEEYARKSISGINRSLVME